MKKIISILLTILTAICLTGQTLSPTLIASTGSFSSNANGSLSYTVGEKTMVQTFTGGNIILTQGFQQPNDNLLTGLLDLTNNEFCLL